MKKLMLVIVFSLFLIGMIGIGNAAYNQDSMENSFKKYLYYNWEGDSYNSPIDECNSIEYKTFINFFNNLIIGVRTNETNIINTKDESFYVKIISDECNIKAIFLNKSNYSDLNIYGEYSYYYLDWMGGVKVSEFKIKDIKINTIKGKILASFTGVDKAINKKIMWENWLNNGI